MNTAMQSDKLINESDVTTNINDLFYAIIGAALNVHKLVGAGMNSDIYYACLTHELDELGLNYECHVQIPFFYKNHFIDTGVNIDLLVEDRISVNIVTDEFISENTFFKSLNQLRHANLYLGIIFNFNVKHLKGEAIRRVINGHF